MNNLGEIKALPKTGNEYLTHNGRKTNYNLFDFWQWSVSDLLSNATRGRLAEFIVGAAVCIDPKNTRDEWDAYDITTADGIKIEVKSSAYIQSWSQKKFSSIIFGIKPTGDWDPKITKWTEERIRYADVYVFCHLSHKDPDTIDPLKLEQWDFYVVPTSRLDQYAGKQSSITLNSLKVISEPIQYGELRIEIERAYKV